MKIGLMPGAPREAGALGRVARLVESAGFDSLWIGDHEHVALSPLSFGNELDEQIERMAALLRG